MLIKYQFNYKHPNTFTLFKKTFLIQKVHILRDNLVKNISSLFFGAECVVCVFARVLCVSLASVCVCVSDKCTAENLLSNFAKLNFGVFSYVLMSVSS